MSLCWCQSLDITRLTKDMWMSNNFFVCLFDGMTNTSKDMTKTTWTFLSELPTCSLKTCRTLSAGSANNRVVWIITWNFMTFKWAEILKKLVLLQKSPQCGLGTNLDKFRGGSNTCFHYITTVWTNDWLWDKIKVKEKI